MIREKLSRKARFYNRVWSCTQRWAPPGMSKYRKARILRFQARQRKKR